LVKFYHSLPGAEPILDLGDVGDDGVHLQTHAHFHKHLKVLGRHLLPAEFTRKKTPVSALVRALVGEENYYREATTVFTHQQGRNKPQDFVSIRWMRASLYNLPKTEDVWHNFQ
jgi:hypothetical protein